HGGEKFVVFYRIFLMPCPSQVIIGGVGARRRETYCPLQNLPDALPLQDMVGRCRGTAARNLFPLQEIFDVVSLPGYCRWGWGTAIAHLLFETESP
ncbi:MAG: hypothetical protein AB4426_17500, partial [Xenococcaceae cyanobacterium]